MNMNVELNDKVLFKILAALGETVSHEEAIASLGAAANILCHTNVEDEKQRELRQHFGIKEPARLTAKEKI